MVAFQVGSAVSVNKGGPYPNLGGEVIFEFKGQDVEDCREKLLENWQFGLIQHKWELLEKPTEKPVAETEKLVEFVADQIAGGFWNQPLRIRMGYVIWLVVWNINFIFPYIGNFIIPIDFHIFQRGDPTTNQLWSFTKDEEDGLGLSVNLGHTIQIVVLFCAPKSRMKMGMDTYCT